MGKSILIAEDAAFVRMTLKNILLENGYEVVGEAADGKEAVTMYRELKPDLVMLDVSMPWLDGIGALKEIMAYDPQAACIMCCAGLFPEQKQACMDAGAKDIVLKPYDPNKLLEAVRQVIE